MEKTKYEIYPAVRIGGQQVGRTETGVKATCNLTGLIAISKSERSQHRNRAICDVMLNAGREGLKK